MSSRANLVGGLRNQADTEKKKRKQALRAFMREQDLTGDGLRALLKETENDYMRFEDNIISIKKAFEKASDIERVTIYSNELIPELDRAVKEGIITEEDKNAYATEFNEIGMNPPSI